ncbi:MAG TPA: hypothetical protein V6C65_33310, partial [Allocoleopsis sp.]
MTANVQTKFNFKARTIKDEEGKEIGKTKKQAPVVVNLPVPTAAELIAALSQPDVERIEGEGDNQRTVVEVPKVKALILDAVVEQIRAQARDQFDEIIDGFGTDQEKVVT